MYIRTGNGRRRVAAGVGVAAFTVTMLVAGCGTDAATGSAGGGTIVFGAIMDQTGYLASNDKPALAGEQAAVAYINDHGGLLGKKLQLASYDDASEPGQAVSDMQSALTKNNATAVLGGTSSAPAAAAAPIAAQSGRAFIVIAVVASNLKDAFSISPSQMADAATRLAYAQHLGIKTMGVLATQSPYSKGLTAAVTALAPKYGIRVVKTEYYDTDATDLSAQVNGLLASKPQAIIKTGSDPVDIAAAQAMAQAGVTLPLFLDQNDMTTIKEAMADYPDTTWLATAPQLYPVLPAADRTTSLVNFMKSRNTSLDPLAEGRGWDLVEAAAAAIKKAGSTSPAAILTALNGGVTYNGVTADFTFSANHRDAAVGNPYYIGKFVDGSPVLVFTPPSGS